MDDETLIGLIEQCPHLYNKSLKEYKDDKLKESSWMSSAEHLQSDLTAVKKRWDNLRDRFVRAHRDYSEQPPSGSAGETKKVITFPYFGVMMWLAPYLRKRKLTSSFKTCKKIVHEGLALQSTDVQNLENTLPDDEVQVETYDVEANEILSRSSVDLPDSRPGSSQFGNIPTPKTKKPILYDSMVQVINSFTKICETKYQSPQTNSSESDINFMKSVVADMQMLTPKNKLKFKKQIMDLLLKYVDEA